MKDQKETSAPTPRDVRVDQIGFANELKKHFIDDLKTSVKTRMMTTGTDRCQGDFFEALLADGMRSTIDPVRFFKLFQQKKITKKQFLSAISVGSDAAKAFLSLAAVAEISSSVPVQSLTVTRKKDVQIELVDAVSTLGAAIAKNAAV